MTTRVMAKSDAHQWLMLAFYFGALFALFLLSNELFASSGTTTTSTTSSGGQTIGTVAGKVKGTMTEVAGLITAVSYVAGVAFALMGMLKLKAHKDQPTQVPLSQPMVLLIIAAGLIFLPSLVETMGGTFWGTGKRGTAAGTGLETTTSGG